MSIIKKNLLPNRPTKEQLDLAIIASKAAQAHLATVEDSIIRNGNIVVLKYDPFPNNWRLSKTIILDTVEL